ncbi:MAG: peptidyl-prolyl cis-trans isomerase [Fluviibacter sp.]
MKFKALRPSTLATTLVAVALVSATSAFAAGNVATVNGTAIPQSLSDALVSEKVAQGAQDNAQLRQAVREELIDRELIVQAAKKAGLDKQPDVQTAIRLADQGVLIRAYQITYAQKHVPSDAQLKQLYDQTMANMGKEEFKTRLIIVQSQATAKEVTTKLDSGDSFESVAKQYSVGPNAKENGGDIGWNPITAFPKPVADAVVKLGKGKYTPAVSADNVWFVVQLEDRRPFTPPSFDQAKAQFRDAVINQEFQKDLQKMRASAKVQ